MSKIFYRFRSLENLLGKYKELEKEEIYFASPEELNDPMEGFKEIIFNGDEILWKNLFKHYVLCLHHVCLQYIISGDNNQFTEDIIPIYHDFNDFPTDFYKKQFEAISNKVLKLCEPLINRIVNRSTDIRKHELYIYLSHIHFIAIKIIKSTFVELNIQKDGDKIFIEEETIINNLNKLIDSIEEIAKTNKKDQVDSIFFTFRQKEDEQFLLNRGITVNSFNQNFLYKDFINNYLNSIEKLIYSKWYTACFMTESHNSSVWGHYGDNHKGVCLIFNADDKECFPFLNMKIGHGREGSIYGKANLKLHKINYSDKFTEIDFFKSIGQLTTYQLNNTWYKDTNFFQEVFHDEERWRIKHWDMFYNTVLTKTTDWKYEKEYRLILTSSLDDNIKKEDRSIQYDFNNLKGLIFGIRVPYEEKVKIIKIIEDKCNRYNRKDFEYYQAYYCHIKKNIQHNRIL